MTIRCASSPLTSPCTGHAVRLRQTSEALNVKSAKFIINLLKPSGFSPLHQV